MKRNVIQLLKMFSKYVLIGIFAQCVFYTLVAAGRSDAQQVHSVYDVELNVERSSISVQELLHFIEAKTNYVFAYDKKRPSSKQSDSPSQSKRKSERLAPDDLQGGTL